MIDPASRRRDFPALESQAYLNTAAEGIPPRVVLDALARYGKDKLLGMDGRPLHEARRRSLRARAGRALGLEPEEIGFCSCSSEAYNLAALALQLRPGDEVIITDLDFPAGATPWLQPSCPASVKVWQARQGALRVDDLQPLLSSRTRLLALSLVSFFSGFKVPLEAVVETTRRHSAALVAVDVTQALGRVPLDLAGADLIVSSTHKWILATHGGGLVGVPRRRTAEWTVPAGGWFNLEEPFLREDRLERAVSKPGADSFSVGMPNYAAVYAVNAALGYIDSVGVEAIAGHADPLVRACLEGLGKLPVELITPDEGDALAGIVSFRHPRAEHITRILHQRNVHIMSHAGRLRVAIHGYNTMDDVENLLNALGEALKGA